MPKIIFGRLSSPKKLLQLEGKTQKIQDLLHSSQHRIVDNIDNLDTSWIVIPWSIITTHQEFNCRRIPPQPQGRRPSRSPKASLRTSSLRPSHQPLEEFAKAGSSPTLEIIFGRLLSPKKLLLHLQFFWKN